MKKIWFLLVASCFFLAGFSQDPARFKNDVETIKRFDKIYPPPPSPVLFIGSSSIRLWPELQKTFCERTVLNRGIGGAVVNDILYYADDILFPYEPAHLVIFVGENDLPDEHATADSIFRRVKRLYELIRKKLPAVPVEYIALKPSPVRAQYFEKAKEANRLISNYLSGKPNTHFIDIYTPMVTKEGKPRPELFVKDMLHMNEAGYKIWEGLVRPYLQKP